MRLRVSVVLQCACCLVLLGGLTYAPASAQVGNNIKAKIMNQAATDLVNKIQTESCSEFAASLKKAKSNSSSGSSKAGSTLKSDPAARAQFVNKVAGPLVNKMIDCDMMPHQ